jgi:hypothetical protein
MWDSLRMLTICLEPSRFAPVGAEAGGQSASSRPRVTPAGPVRRRPVRDE